MAGEWLDRAVDWIRSLGDQEDAECIRLIASEVGYELPRRRQHVLRRLRAEVTGKRRNLGPGLASGALLALGEVLAAYDAQLESEARVVDARALLAKPLLRDILCSIEAGTGATSQIAAKLDRDKAQVSRALTQLTALGLVIEQVPELDRRRRPFRLTGSGVRCLADARAHERSVQTNHASIEHLVRAPGPDLFRASQKSSCVGVLEAVSAMPVAHYDKGPRIQPLPGQAAKSLTTFLKRDVSSSAMGFGREIGVVPKSSRKMEKELCLTA